MTDIAETTEQPTEAAEASMPPRGKPHRLPRRGSVHATVFENLGTNGTFYTVNLEHWYNDGETWKYNRSFKVTDMADVRSRRLPQRKRPRSSRARKGNRGSRMPDLTCHAIR